MRRLADIGAGVRGVPCRHPVRDRVECLCALVEEEPCGEQAACNLGAISHIPSWDIRALIGRGLPPAPSAQGADDGWHPTPRGAAIGVKGAEQAVAKGGHAAGVGAQAHVRPRHGLIGHIRGTLHHARRKLVAPAGPGPCPVSRLLAAVPKCERAEDVILALIIPQDAADARVGECLLKAHGAGSAGRAARAAGHQRIVHMHSPKHTGGAEGVVQHLHAARG